MGDGVGIGALLGDIRSESGSLRELVVIQREDVTTASSFHISQPGVTMPIDGPGRLVNAVVAAETDDFDVTFTIDRQTVVDNAFTTLQTRSNELERVAAYERADGQFVFAATDYDFLSEVDIVIEPRSSITFALQRAEIDLVRGP